MQTLDERIAHRDMGMVACQRKGPKWEKLGKEGVKLGNDIYLYNVSIVFQGCHEFHEYFNVIPDIL